MKKLFYFYGGFEVEGGLTEYGDTVLDAELTVQAMPTFFKGIVSEVSRAEYCGVFEENPFAVVPDGNDIMSECLSGLVICVFVAPSLQ